MQASAAAHCYEQRAPSTRRRRPPGACMPSLPLPAHSATSSRLPQHPIVPLKCPALQLLPLLHYL